MKPKVQWHVWIISALGGAEPEGTRVQGKPWLHIEL